MKTCTKHKLSTRKFTNGNLSSQSLCYDTKAMFLVFSLQTVRQHFIARQLIERMSEMT